MTEASKPGPCPFCRDAHYLLRDDGIGYWHVECRNCSASGSTKGGVDEAIAAWNAPGERERMLREALTGLLACCEYCPPRAGGGAYGPMLSTQGAKERLALQLAREALTGELCLEGATHLKKQRARITELETQNKKLREAAQEALPWLEKAAPLLNTSAPWERLREALKE